MELRELFRTLYSVDHPQGCTDEEINTVKEIFGTLPAVVEDFWRTFGRTQRLNCVQDTWILPEHYSKWSWPGASEFLVLLNENQGCCQAGIRREDLSLPDPPVYEFVNDEAQELISPSVSEFLKAALTYEAVWQMEYASEEFYWLTDGELTEVQGKLTKHSAVLKNWMEYEFTFYSNRPDNLLVVIDVGDQYQCLFGAATEESYLELIDVMEGLGEPL